MDIKFSKLKKKNDNTVSISAELLEEVVSVLRNVECTCVWSEHDGQYIKVNDVGQDMVHDIEFALKLSKLKR